MKITRKRSSGLIAAVIALISVLAFAAPAAADNFLWRIESDKGTAYITGSIHLARPDLYPLAPAFDEAFEDSDVLAIEADVTEVDQNMVQQWFLEHGVYPENDNILKHISKKTAEKLEQAGLDPKTLGRVKPWLLAITLEVQKLKELGFDEQYGLDQHFLNRAHQSEMPVAELESFEYQLKLFTNLSEKEQDLFLYYTLLELENIEKQMDTLISAWKSGDADGFVETFFEGVDEQEGLKPILDKVIFDRNAAMVDKIETYIESGRTYFVVIGAGHVAGPKGVLERLESKGYRIEQL
jgi:uncharacterized protein YbaP (TraB family)